MSLKTDFGLIASVLPINEELPPVVDDRGNEAGNEHFRASFSKCALLLMFRRPTFHWGLARWH